MFVIKATAVVLNAVPIKIAAITQNSYFDLSSEETESRFTTSLVNPAFCMKDLMISAIVSVPIVRAVLQGKDYPFQFFQSPP